MSVYFKFDDHDILYSVINASPKITMASGSAGWRGNTGVSSSLSLYGGVRGRTDVFAGAPSGLNVYPLDPMDTNTIDKVVYVSGSYPSTGSVHFVKCRSGSIDALTAIDPFLYNESTLVTQDDWYEEHFNPILGLFDYYSKFNPEYVTGSYDYYSIYLQQNVKYIAPCVYFSGNLLTPASSSATFMAQVKPTALVGGQDYTIQSQFQKFKFYVTGSTGKLAFSDYHTYLTSSSPLSLGTWQGVAVAIGGGSASFYINGNLDIRVAYTGTLSNQTGSFLQVGAEIILSGTAAARVFDNGFKGFIFESRVQGITLTDSQVSSSWNTVLSSSGSTSTLHYARFTDGPLGTRHGFSQGSGSYDSSPAKFHGSFINIGTTLPVSPIWQPNDNVSFVTRKRRVEKDVGMFRVLHVPSMFYGRQIATGSVNLVCDAYSNQGLRRVIMDDGRGSLYLSGSVCRSVSGEDYTGVQWRKVGNVFYSEGLVVITDPSLMDFGEINRDTSTPNDTLQVNFRGLERISTRTFMCRVGAAQANASNNPTFATLNPDTGKFELTLDDGTTWITAIGLYNETRDLIAVAKLAQPIRKREKDKLNIKLRFDY